MTHEEVKALVEEIGLPYAYDHFAEGESPDPPFICFLYPKAENFGADNLVYHHFNRLDIEVYTDYKDPDMEASIEEVLTGHKKSHSAMCDWVGKCSNRAIRFQHPRNRQGQLQWFQGDEAFPLQK